MNTKPSLNKTAFVLLKCVADGFIIFRVLLTTIALVCVLPAYYPQINKARCMSIAKLKNNLNYDVTLIELVAGKNYHFQPSPQL